MAKTAERNYKPCCCGCGGKADSHLGEITMNHDKWFVACDVCGVRTPLCDTRLEAVTIWNRVMSAKDINVPINIIHCKDCKWWEKDDDNPYGYCHAIKHGLLTANWDISIRRKYKADFFCADAEMKEDDDEENI